MSELEIELKVSKVPAHECSIDDISIGQLFIRDCKTYMKLSDHTSMRVVGWSKGSDEIIHLIKHTTKDAFECIPKGYVTKMTVEATSDE